MSSHYTPKRKFYTGPRQAARNNFPCYCCRKAKKQGVRYSIYACTLVHNVQADSPFKLLIGYLIGTQVSSQLA
jgi:hypothetical protein